VTRLSAQAPAAPPPNAAKIPLSKIPRVHHAPKLEDFLENHPREAELTVTDFRQNAPGDGTPATESTTAYLSYDDKNLYAAFVCHDEAGEVRAHLSKREASIRTTPWVCFWTRFGIFTARISSPPIRWGADRCDLHRGARDTTSALTPFGIMRAESRARATCLLSIPFKSLRFSSDPEQTWGVALYRTILRKNEYDYCIRDAARGGVTQQFAPVAGLDNVLQGGTFSSFLMGCWPTTTF